MSLFFIKLTLSAKKVLRSVSPLTIILILLSAASVSTCSFSQEKEGENSLLKWVAGKYGIEAFSDIESISFTFNVRNNDVNTKRSWVWEPKSGEVMYRGPGMNGDNTEYTYNRNQMDTSLEITRFVDPKFINDQYWLLFPFHLVWDKDLDITIAGIKQFPLSKESGTVLIVTYKNNKGYTPNGVFELFLDQDNMIRESIYRPKGSTEKQSIYTWEQNRNFDGIIISTEHYGPDNKTKVWFTDIKVARSHTYK